MVVTVFMLIKGNFLGCHQMKKESDSDSPPHFTILAILMGLHRIHKAIHLFLKKGRLVPLKNK